ncbi:MAG: PAS domain S-box protein [Caldisericia bacterium]|nr:PAS domain S-box protein [Caldisericia bacterium]
MRKNTIFRKIFINFVIVIFITAGLFLLFSSQIVKTYYINTLSKDLEQVARTVSSSVKFMHSSNEKESIQEFVKEIGLSRGYRITIVGSDGVVWGDSEKNPEEMENHKNRPEIIKALKGEIGTSIRYSKTTKEYMLYVAVPIRRDGEIIGVARASMFMKSIYNLINTLKTRLIFSTLLSSIAALLLSYFLSKGITTPIKELVEFSKRISMGVFSEGTIPKRNDEIGELMENMNIMAKRIGKLVENLKSESETLETIIKSIDEAILLIDGNGVIKHANDEFKNLIGKEKVEERYYWEVVKDDELRKFIKKALDKESMRERIQIKDRNFILSSRKIETANKILVTFYDVTELQKYEEMKKEFIGNLSHELKTPLTSIKGFVEVMKEEGKLKYIDIIERNIDRMIQIVKDIQMLSKLEYRKTKAQIESVDALDILKDIEKLFYKKAEEKGLNLLIEVEEKPFYIKVDPYLFEEMLVNLVDNAIRYTDRGSVSVKIYRGKGGFFVEVKDTGIGIPKEHIDRIFERFYVVDKSRSKRTGGTGLGLSIVKHIVLLHNGKIDVRSVPGEGTTFTIFIPQNP